jgi:hypothetical protein
MFVSISTFTIVVTTQAPGGAPVVVAAASEFGWTYEAATSYVRDQTMTMPAGTKLAIVTEICRAPEEQELCERSARDAATSGTNLATVAQALGVKDILWTCIQNTDLPNATAATREAIALAILKAAQDMGKDVEAILNAFALEG